MMAVRTRILIILSLLWMIFIFIMSSLTKETSSDVSNSVTAIVVDAMYGDNKPHNAEEAGWKGTAPTVIEDIEKGLVPKDDLFGRSKFWFKNDIRKLAHLVQFFVLAVLVNLTFLSHFRKNRVMYVVLSFGITGLYAALDELHQMFVPGRGAQVKDVVIDCVGAAFGIALIAVLCFAVKLFKTIKYRQKPTV